MNCVDLHVSIEINVNRLFILTRKYYLIVKMNSVDLHVSVEINVNKT